MGSPVLICTGTARQHGLSCIQHRLGSGWWSPWDKGINTHVKPAIWVFSDLHQLFSTKASNDPARPLGLIHPFCFPAQKCPQICAHSPAPLGSLPPRSQVVLADRSCHGAIPSTGRHGWATHDGRLTCLGCGFVALPWACLGLRLPLL